MLKCKYTFRRKVFIALGALLLVKIAFLGVSGVFENSHVKPSSAHAQTAKKAETNGKPAKDNAPMPVTRNPGPGELDLEIIEDVERRNKELDLKEENLKREQERISAMKGDLDKQISELKALQAKIEEQINLRTDLEKGSIQKLAKTYAAMPPENAAALLQQIDMSIAIRVLGAMKERAAGRILAVIPPKLASTFSEGLVRKR